MYELVQLYLVSYWCTVDKSAVGGGVRYGYPSGEVYGDVAADDDANVPTFTKGDFVFFLGSKAPFLLGKVTN